MRLPAVLYCIFFTTASPILSVFGKVRNANKGSSSKGSSSKGSSSKISKKHDDGAANTSTEEEVGVDGDGTATTPSMTNTRSIQEILLSFEEWIEYGMNLTQTPGVAVSIVEGDTVAHLGGYGFRDLENKIPVTPTSVFQLASVSKPITGSLMAVLVGDKLVDWDTTIASLDPPFALNSPYVTAQVTIRDMLSHRSGLPDHAGDLQEDNGYAMEDILYNLRQLPLEPLRQQWVYTNFGFSEAGYAAAKKAGVPWDDLIRQKIFEPLNMEHTSSRFEDYVSSPERAVTYQVLPGDDGEVVPKRVDPPRDADKQSPAGGVSSTAADMAQWLIAQLGHRPDVIDGAALVQSHQAVVVKSQNNVTGIARFYGMGWDVEQGDDGLELSHSGGFYLGARTVVSVRPGGGIGLAVLANASPTGLPEALNYAFFELVNNRTPDKEMFDFINEYVVTSLSPQINSYSAPAELRPANLTLYVNTYSNDYWGPVPVKHNPELYDGLQLHIGPSASYNLTHIGDHVFAFKTVGENTVGDTQVVFAVGADGVVRSMQIDYMVPNKGQGFFTPAASTNVK
jgi:CubicO group peptidase (beta-lactamase class C family)